MKADDMGCFGAPEPMDQHRVKLLHEAYKKEVCPGSEVSHRQAAVDLGPLLLHEAIYLESWVHSQQVEQGL